MGPGIGGSAGGTYIIRGLMGPGIGGSAGCTYIYTLISGLTPGGERCWIHWGLIPDPHYIYRS